MSEVSMRAAIFRSPTRLVVLAAAAVLVIDAGGTDDGAGICVFRRCTGGYCPGCGMTRSARHVMHGELSAAWRDHPWVVLAGAQLLVAAAVYGMARRLGRLVAWNRALVVIAGVNAAMVVGIWVVRLADGSIPRFF